MPSIIGLFVLALQFIAISADPRRTTSSVASTKTVTVTTTSTSYYTSTILYRAGLVLINSMSLSGVDAYKKDFTVFNTATISFANSDLNIFMLPSDATCMIIETETST